MNIQFFLGSIFSVTGSSLDRSNKRWGKEFNEEAATKQLNSYSIVQLVKKYNSWFEIKHSSWFVTNECKYNGYCRCHWWIEWYYLQCGLNLIKRILAKRQQRKRMMRSTWLRSLLHVQINVFILTNHLKMKVKVKVKMTQNFWWLREFWIQTYTLKWFWRFLFALKVRNKVFLSFGWFLCNRQFNVLQSACNSEL